jgi:photosystem II stability/assembly factor-like uncharacterized protein
MKPDERDLRNALDARSGDASPEFRARLSAALTEAGRPGSNLMPALAAVAAVVLVFATVGVLLLARQARNLPPPATAVATPTPTSPLLPGILVKPPRPIVLPGTAQLSAPSTNVLWVLMEGQYLYRSTDRGNTWEQRPLPASFLGALQSEISFVSDSEGWLSTVGSPETQCNAQTVGIWHTTDAGATWQSLGSKGIADSQCKSGLSFVDPNRGFLDAWDDNHAPVVYRTADGGQTWTASTPLPDPPGFKTTGSGMTLHAGLVHAFGSTLLLPAFGQQSGAQVLYAFRSPDGGATWTYLARSPNQDGTIAFVTASRWIQLIGPGQSIETSDAGARWHPYGSDYSQAAPVAADFVFGDPLVGYATVRGSISRTVDGGLHWDWTSVRSPGT